MSGFDRIAEGAVKAVRKAIREQIMGPDDNSSPSNNNNSSSSNSSHGRRAKKLRWSDSEQGEQQKKLDLRSAAHSKAESVPCPSTGAISTYPSAPTPAATRQSADGQRAGESSSSATSKIVRGPSGGEIWEDIPISSTDTGAGTASVSDDEYDFCRGDTPAYRSEDEDYCVVAPPLVDKKNKELARESHRRNKVEKQRSDSHPQAVKEKGGDQQNKLDHFDRERARRILDKFEKRSGNKGKEQEQVTSENKTHTAVPVEETMKEYPGCHRHDDAKIAGQTTAAKTEPQPFAHALRWQVERMSPQRKAVLFGHSREVQVPGRKESDAVALGKRDDCIVRQHHGVDEMPPEPPTAKSESQPSCRTITMPREGTYTLHCPPDGTESPRPSEAEIAAATAGPLTRQPPRWQKRRLDEDHGQDDQLLSMNALLSRDNNGNSSTATIEKERETETEIKRDNGKGKGVARESNEQQKPVGYLPATPWGRAWKTLTPQERRAPYGELVEKLQRLAAEQAAREAEEAAARCKRCRRGAGRCSRHQNPHGQPDPTSASSPSSSRQEKKGEIEDKTEQTKAPVATSNAGVPVNSVDYYHRIYTLDKQEVEAIKTRALREGGCVYSEWTKQQLKRTKQDEDEEL